MKRLFDLLIGSVLLLFLAFPMLLIVVAIYSTSKGSLLYWSERVGKNNRIFKMPKFRSMILNTPEVATNLLDDPDLYLSPIGGFLRRTSLDEIPQIFSVLKGDMSLVGPRPALFNQEDLITLRTKMAIDKILPGITGWAQVNGRDQISIVEKVNLDLEYMRRQSFWFDIKILLITLLKVIKSIDVNH
jgi:O-antigen biosynthesis protein WbqP